MYDLNNPGATLLAVFVSSPCYHWVISMNNSLQPPLRLRLPMTAVMFVCASALAQDIRSSDQADSTARPLLRIAHEWVGPGVPGAGFVCAVIWPTGEYHLERNRPLLVSVNKVLSMKESVHEGLISDRAMRDLNSSIHDPELMAVPNQQAPSDSIETWRFDIFRIGSVQTIQAGTGKSIRGLELLRKTLTSLEKHSPRELSGAKLTNCNHVPRPSLSAKKAPLEE